eukprot:5942175-Lingulodinium_polyedra.AAC.1
MQQHAATTCSHNAHPLHATTTCNDKMQRQDATPTCNDRNSSSDSMQQQHATTARDNDTQ